MEGTLGPQALNELQPLDKHRSEEGVVGCDLDCGGTN